MKGQVFPHGFLSFGVSRLGLVMPGRGMGYVCCDLKRFRLIPKENCFLTDGGTYFRVVSFNPRAVQKMAGHLMVTHGVFVFCTLHVQNLPNRVKKPKIWSRRQRIQQHTRR